jgi:uncharacterized membrane protein
MNLRPLAVAAIVAITVMLVAAAWGWGQVPAGTQVPIHWGIDGQPDGFAPKEVGFFLLPALAAGVTVLLMLLPRFEPRSANLVRSSSAYRQVGIAMLVVVTVIQLTTVLAAAGRPVNVSLVVGLTIGGLFVVLGNVLGKVRSNFIFGVRTPWTLASDRSWNKTHRLVGRLFVLLGLAVVVAGLVGGYVALFSTLIGGIALILVVGSVYSYRVWKADPDRLTIGHRT